MSRASGQPLPPYTIRTNRGLRHIASQAQVSFPFLLYYFINNFILLQTKLLLYNSSIMVAPPQSWHRCKQGPWRGKSKETAGEGNRGLRHVVSWAQVHFFLFFFLISLIKYVNRYYSAMTSTVATGTPTHHHHTYITSIRHGNMMKGGGLVCFLFYILLLHI